MKKLKGAQYFDRIDAGVIAARFNRKGDAGITEMGEGGGECDGCGHLGREHGILDWTCEEFGTSSQSGYIYVCPGQWIVREPSGFTERMCHSDFIATFKENATPNKLPEWALKQLLPVVDANEKWQKAKESDVLNIITDPEIIRAVREKQYWREGIIFNDSDTPQNKNCERGWFCCDTCERRGGTPEDEIVWCAQCGVPECKKRLAGTSGRWRMAKTGVMVCGGGCESLLATSAPSTPIGLEPASTRKTPKAGTECWGHPFCGSVALPRGGWEFQYRGLWDWERRPIIERATVSKTGEFTLRQRDLPPNHQPDSNIEDWFSDGPMDWFGDE